MAKSTSISDKSAIVVIDTAKAVKSVAATTSPPKVEAAPTLRSTPRTISFRCVLRQKKMIVLSAPDGHIITDLPIGNGSDGATFNPETMEAFSSQGDGTLTVIKEEFADQLQSGTDRCYSGPGEDAHSRSQD